MDPLVETARALMARGKGLLAADESVGTITRRFDALGIAAAPENRRAYREMLFSAPELSRYVSGVILHDETLRQRDGHGRPFAEVLVRASIIPGIKVDLGARPLAGCPGETVTEGLDGLRARLEEYRALGARFAKWRAVLHVGDHLPSVTCIDVNAHALARYAALCQEVGLVPIVEPEVLMDGGHSLARAEQVTAEVQERVFAELRAQRVVLERLLLKPNMVVPGKDSHQSASPREVAAATLRVLRRQVPAAVPGVVFLSGGQSEREASANLNAINAPDEPRPWTVSFSFARALQDSAMRAWGGQPSGVLAGQEALLRRARCNSAAALGQYDDSMDAAPAELTVH
jgi:fructose-bisphosphate aldolase class I